MPEPTCSFFSLPVTASPSALCTASSSTIGALAASSRLQGVIICEMRMGNWNDIFPLRNLSTHDTPADALTRRPIDSLVKRDSERADDTCSSVPLLPTLSLALPLCALPSSHAALARAYASPGSSASSSEREVTAPAGVDLLRVRESPGAAPSPSEKDAYVCRAAPRKVPVDSLSSLPRCASSRKRADACVSREKEREAPSCSFWRSPSASSACTDDSPGSAFSRDADTPPAPSPYEDVAKPAKPSVTVRVTGHWQDWWMDTERIWGKGECPWKRGRREVDRSMAPAVATLDSSSRSLLSFTCSSSTLRIFLGCATYSPSSLWLASLPLSISSPRSPYSSYAALLLGSFSTSNARFTSRKCSSGSARAAAERCLSGWKERARSV
jgi:hypothetical protein